ncbi:hypothetical protein V8D89_000427 [Ganoderma adspersum]
MTFPSLPPSGLQVVWTALFLWLVHGVHSGAGLNIDTPGPLREFNNLTRSPFLWQAKVLAGSQLYLGLFDSSDNETVAFSGAFDIQSGDGTCLGLEPVTYEREYVYTWNIYEESDVVHPEVFAPAVHPRSSAVKCNLVMDGSPPVDDAAWQTIPTQSHVEAPGPATPVRMLSDSGAHSPVVHTNYFQSLAEDCEEDSSYNESSEESTEGSEVDSESAEGSDSELSVTNSELAEILLSKTEPISSSTKRSKKRHKSTRAAAAAANKIIQPSRSHKRKRKKDDSASRRASKKQAIDPPDRGHPESNEEVNASFWLITMELQKQANVIYAFYEPVDNNAHGLAGDKGDKHYRCWHADARGERKVLTITKKMKGSTTGLIGHLRKHFPEAFRLYEILRKRDMLPSVLEMQLARGQGALTHEEAHTYIEDLEKKADALVQSLQGSLNEPWDQDQFEQLLTEWIAACDQPFDAVEKLELHSLLQYTYHRPEHLDIPSAATIKKRIMDLSDKYVEELAVTIKTIGGWVMAINCDNATSNDTLIAEIESLCHEHGIRFSAKQAQMHCVPHTIHLSALELLSALGVISKADQKAASSGSRCNYQESVTAPVDREHDNELVGQDDPPEEGESDTAAATTATTASSVTYGHLHQAIQKLRKIIRAIRTSPQRRQAWLEEVRRHPELVKANTSEMALMLILDVPTRWSSMHSMLRRVCTHQVPIDKFVCDPANKDLRQYELSWQDWEALSIITQWLQLYRDAILEMSVTTRPTISEVSAVFKGLQEHLCKLLTMLPKGTPRVLRDGLVNAHYKLSDYSFLFDGSPFYAWASLLDPRISHKNLEINCGDDDEALRDLHRQISDLREYYRENYCLPAVSSSSNPLLAESFSQVAITASVLSTPRRPPPSSSRRLLVSPDNKTDFTARYQTRTPASTAQDELDEYFALKPQPFKSCDPLQWWSVHQAQFSTLSKLGVMWQWSECSLEAETLSLCAVQVSSPRPSRS